MIRGPNIAQTIAQPEYSTEKLVIFELSMNRNMAMKFVFFFLKLKYHYNSIT